MPKHLYQFSSLNIIKTLNKIFNNPLVDLIIVSVSHYRITKCNKIIQIQALY